MTLRTRDLIRNVLFCCAYGTVLAVLLYLGA